MFEFDYTLSSIAKFNAIKDSTETRAMVVGTLIGYDVMANWYREQLTELWSCNRDNGVPMGYVCEVMDNNGGRLEFVTHGMQTDSNYGVCEDKDVRCIRFWRMKNEDGEMIYGYSGRLFKKKAGLFMREIIKDSGIQYNENQVNYICTRFAVEWMEARMAQWGSDEWMSADINIGVTSSEARDLFFLGEPFMEQIDESRLDEVMAEVAVLKSGRMMTGTPDGGSVHVEASKPWVICGHGECDSGTDNWCNICASEDDAKGKLYEYWIDNIELYHINEDEIEWDDAEVTGEYDDIEITRLDNSFSIYKGDFGADFVHIWIQQAK